MDNGHEKLSAIKSFTHYLRWLYKDITDAHDELNGASLNPKGQLVTIHSGLSERNLMKRVDEIIKDIKDYAQSLEHYRNTLEERCDTWQKTPEQ